MDKDGAPMMTPAQDALSLLLPPADFIPLMLEVLRRKSLRDDRMPDAWAKWLIRMREIRAGVVVPCVAGLTDDEWAELGECCREFGEFVREER